MDNKDERERDFQVYLGWKVPVIIKLAWLLLGLWIAFYLIMFLVPSLREWI